MGGLLYLLIPIAIVVGIWLGIRYRNSSRQMLAGPLSGSVASNDGSLGSGSPEISGGDGGSSSD